MYSFWLILTAILIIYFQNQLYKKYIFTGFKIERNFQDKYLFPDDNSALEITITNEKLLPMLVKMKQTFPLYFDFDSKSEIRIANDHEYLHEVCFNILPYEKIKLKYNITFQKRGHYELLGNIDITSTNLLGTENYFESISSQTCITVYPKLKDVLNYLIPAKTLQGDIFINRWIIEDPMMIKGIRNYGPADPLKSINWKATAKNLHLMVNEYDYTAEKKIMLIFDLGIKKNMFVTDRLPEVENAIEVAASISTKLISEGIPVGFITNATCKGNLENTILNPDTGNEQASKILDLLGRVSYYKSISLSDTLSLSLDYLTWGTEVILVTPSLNNELISTLQNFTDISITVISLDIKNPESLPKNINLFFYSEEGENNESIANYKIS